MANKPLASNVLKSVEKVLSTAGEDVGKLYQSATHRSVVALVAVQSLIAEGLLTKEEGPDAMMTVYTALAQESNLLEHSNFKKRLADLGLVSKPEDKPKNSGIVAVEF
jgi:hypothetical protein